MDGSKTPGTTFSGQEEFGVFAFKVKVHGVKI